MTNYLPMEGLKEILDSIKEHTQYERSHYVPNKSIARGNVTMKDGREMTVWVVNRQYTTTADTTYGKWVTSKNTRWGQILTSRFKGEGECMGYDSAYRPVKREFTINNSASYFNNSSLDNLKVGISTEPSWRYFKNIHEAYNAINAGLAELLKIQKQEEEAKKALMEAQLKIQQEKEEKAKKALEEEERRIKKEKEEELARLEARSQEVKKEILDSINKYKAACSFIRTQASLRINPIIDAAQNAVKFSHVYDGTCVVVDGGPGTGKTTTLIQRLKYLISRIDLEDNMLNNPDIKITSEQFDVITHNDGDWLFFSPTELLRMYLRDAMNEEGLTDTENRTAVWSKHLRKLLRDYYHLIGSDCPFSGSSESKPMFVKEEMAVAADFLNYLITNLVAEIKSNTNIDSSKYSWKYIGATLNKHLEKLDNVKDFRSLIAFLITLNSIRTTTINGSNEVDLLMSKYKKSVSDMAARLIVAISDDNELYLSLRALINKDLINKVENEDDEDDEEEIDSFAEDKIKISQRLKSMLRSAAVNLIDSSFKFSGINKEFYERIKHLIAVDDLKKLGELALFDKRIRPLLDNPDRFIFNRIPRLYKAYRKNAFSSNSDYWNISVLGNEVSSEKRNRPIHPQEQALLLGTINNIAHTFYKVSPRVFETLKHKYIDAFKLCVKPVIGVDEATDYSLIDYYAIASLRHYIISSVTLAGDIMQGLTVNGINEWAHLYDDLIFPEMDRTPLVTSYRQSPTLLSLAQRLYKKQIGFPAPYRSYLEDTNEVVPKPLWFSSDSEIEKAEWLVERILEVKAKYSFVPSIAVFVSDVNAAARLTEELRSLETLEDESIEVVDCSRGDTLSSKDTVRVFPIDLVKGMEFEVAFFHNVEELSSSMVERYLYVGLSRAAFFLGVTSSSKGELWNTVGDLFSDGNWRQIQ